MDAKIKKMRERLAKQRIKMAEIQAQTEETEQIIKKAEEEQLGYLARSVANTLSGGMDDVFELLRGLREKRNKDEKTDFFASGTNTANSTNAAAYQNSDETKEGETVDEVDETEDSEDES